MAKAAEYTGTGRRKSAVARVRLSNGTGKVIVNGRPLDRYFTVETHRMNIMIPLNVLEKAALFDVRVNVCGGGMAGQSGAVRHGIARALLQADAEHRPALKRQGLLTRDPRAKERKKYGQPGARKRFQYSKR